MYYISSYIIEEKWDSSAIARQWKSRKLSIVKYFATK